MQPPVIDQVIADLQSKVRIYHDEWDFLSRNLARHEAEHNRFVRNCYSSGVPNDVQKDKIRQDITWHITLKASILSAWHSMNRYTSELARKTREKYTS